MPIAKAILCLLKNSLLSLECFRQEDGQSNPKTYLTYYSQIFIKTKPEYNEFYITTPLYTWI